VAGPDGAVEDHAGEDGDAATPDSDYRAAGAFGDGRAITVGFFLLPAVKAAGPRPTQISATTGFLQGMALS